MLLAEGIRNSSTIDKREMNIFFNERRFWRNVLERLIDIALFLSERNLAFRGSEEVLGSPHNGNFLGIFELLARRDPILKELQDRIKNKNTKDHYLIPTIQNELIELLATEVEKENLQQLKLAKYFSIILDCTPDMSHHEQMSVILRYVLCNEEAAVVKETFFGYLKISDSQRWSRGHKARGQGQGHKKNPRPRPRTAFPRTDTLEAKDRNARGQGPRTQSASALQKKKKIFTKVSQAISKKKKKKKGLHKNFSSNLHYKTYSKKFFKHSTKF